MDEDSFYGHVLMQKELGKSWKPIYGFTDEPQIDDDFIMPSFYCDQHPDSRFNKYMKISLFTQDADLTIVKDEMKVYRNGKVEKRLPISGKEEAAHLLSDIFHISVPHNYRLLP
ncbi:arylamine N-acetyltransferase [Megasphaera sp.]|nr:arylamine N-acetyltransferase [Megasphaera sp.]